MAFRAIRVALLLSALPAAGCGTVANLAHTRPEDGGRVPFGGVKRDVACLRGGMNEEPVSGTHLKSESGPYPRQLLTVLCAVDLPFSLIGDVVTWPYTAVYSVVNDPIPVPPLVLADVPVTQPLPPAPVTPPMPLPIPPATQPMSKDQPQVPPEPLPKPAKRP
jgi:uncharacterized protein YceK